VSWLQDLPVYDPTFLTIILNQDVVFSYNVKNSRLLIIVRTISEQISLNFYLQYIVMKFSLI
jgi:hypothetical protein